MHQKTIVKSLPFLFILIAQGMMATLKAQDSFRLYSPAFKDGDTIPAVHTCAGKDVLPTLIWSHPPKGTKSFAIVMDDPDTPMGIWIHWVMYNIPANVQVLKEGAGAADIKAQDGLNSWGIKGYKGPCPPDGEHVYQFTIYALDKVLSTPDMTRDQLVEEMKEHIIGQAELKGKFGM